LKEIRVGKGKKLTKRKNPNQSRWGPQFTSSIKAGEKKRGKGSKSRERCKSSGRSAAEEAGILKRSGGARIIPKRNMKLGTTGKNRSWPEKYWDRESPGLKAYEG